MASKTTHLGAVATMFLVLATSACAQDGTADRVAGCHPPAHEDHLLAGYRSDPVFGFRPPEARTIGTPSAQKACQGAADRTVTRRIGPTPHGDGGAATSTQVSLSFALNVGFTQRQLTTMYDSGIRARGWVPQPLDLPPLAVGGRQAGLSYCRRDDGVASLLSIYETYVGTANRRAPTDVSPSPDGGWPEAGNLTVRITAVRGMACATTPSLAHRAGESAG